MRNMKRLFIAAGLALASLPAHARGIDTREHDPAGCVRLWADALLSRHGSTPYLEHMKALKERVYPKTDAFDFMAYDCQIDRAIARVIACDEWWSRINPNEPPGPGVADDATPDQCREDIR